MRLAGFSKPLLPLWSLALDAGAAFTTALVAAYVLVRRKKPMLDL